MAGLVEEPQLHEENGAAAVDSSSSTTKKTSPPPITSSFSSLSLSIWPPSQRTREAVRDRLVQTLTTPSVLTKRYGSFPHDDADATARRIEEEAFGTASSSFEQKGGAGGPGEEDEGMEILQIYSKEISKRMLDAVKARAAPAAAATAIGSGSAPPAAVKEPVGADEAAAEGAGEETAVGSEVSSQA